MGKVLLDFTLCIRYLYSMLIIHITKANIWVWLELFISFGCGIRDNIRVVDNNNG